MSVLELKQEITRLSKRGREEIYAYLVRLKHDKPECKRTAVRRTRNMEKGRAITIDQMPGRLRWRSNA